MPKNFDNLNQHLLPTLQETIKQKVIIKLLSSPLHAKLYLLFRDDKFNPVIGYLGSSNLTYAGQPDTEIACIFIE